MSDKEKVKVPWNGLQTKKINQEKLQVFSVGINKKTIFQKKQEEAELKKKKETEEAAKVYAEFVASFEQESATEKAWVKGGTVVPSALFDKDEATRQEQDKKTIYRPQQRFVPASTSVAKEKSPDDQESKPPEPKGPRKRNLDSFLEQIKKEQEERDQRLRSKHVRLAGSGVDPLVANDMVETHSDVGSLTLRAAFEERPGSHDTGDPTTTNLYVGNLNPVVNEEMLCKEFGAFGDIASIKIMWPRTQEERDRNRNCGFVSFMKRDDAAEALKAMDGKDLLGYQMRVGWGKAVPLPPQPIYVHEKNAKPLSSGLPFNAQLIHSSKPGFAAVPPPGGVAIPPPSTQPKLEVKVVRPADQGVVMIIHRTVERVVKFGPMFEAMIMDREWDNPQFSFLFQNDTPEHVYYRWKLYSILQGDAKNKWPTESFQMFDEGPIWTPPEVPFDEEEVMDEDSDSSDLSDASSSSRQRKARAAPVKGTLSKVHRLRLENQLRRLTLERGGIAKLMVFSIDRSDAADEIVDIITKSLLIHATPVFPTKMARLYLVSDILHNSAVSVPNAWKFRTGFERRLETVFEHLGQVWRSIGGRLRAEQMRRAVVGLLNVWENWIVFPKPFIDGLREKFLESGKSNDAEKDEQLRSRLQAQKDSKTGLWAMEEDDEDVDGEPLQLHPPRTKKTIAISTKWDNDDDRDGDGGDDDEDIDGVPLDLGITSQTSSLHGSSSSLNDSGQIDESKRQQLRDVETQVVKRMEQLEARGVDKEECRRRGDALRQALLGTSSLPDSNSRHLSSSRNQQSSQQEMDDDDVDIFAG
ncbi:U2 snRNP-associated SURP domain-containing protein [Quaeritorhiza haematococci]|nr:U2 snRNP-associated SURP domain-containing protein [Quaeritorhiza haematococci]